MQSQHLPLPPAHLAAAVEASYRGEGVPDGKEITDEFVMPLLAKGPDGKPLAMVKDGDAAFFFRALIKCRIHTPAVVPASLLVAALPFGIALADEPKSKNEKVTLVYQHELPNVPGKSIKSVLVEYGPRGYSPSHTHAKSAFIYATVLEGAIRSQVNGGPVKVYKAGESFSEMPGDRHDVSANGSWFD